MEPGIIQVILVFVILGGVGYAIYRLIKSLKNLDTNKK